MPSCLFNLSNYLVFSGRGVCQCEKRFFVALFGTFGRRKFFPHFLRVQFSKSLLEFLFLIVFHYLSLLCEHKKSFSIFRRQLRFSRFIKKTKNVKWWERVNFGRRGNWVILLVPTKLIVFQNVYLISNFQSKKVYKCRMTTFQFPILLEKYMTRKNAVPEKKSRDFCRLFFLMSPTFFISSFLRIYTHLFSESLRNNTHKKGVLSEIGESHRTLF